MVYYDSQRTRRYHGGCLHNGLERVRRNSLVFFGTFLSGVLSVIQKIKSQMPNLAPSRSVFKNK